MIDVKLLQEEKVPYPIFVTEFGIVTDVKPEQFSKAPPIIFVISQSKFLIRADVNRFLHHVDHSPLH